MKPGQIALGLLEALPDIMFWIKDEIGSFVFVNQAYGDLVGIKPDEIVGQNDYELFVPELANVFRADDEEVRTSAQAIYNKTELVTRREGGVEWRMTSKIPLLGKDNRVIGTAGISRRLDKPENGSFTTPHDAISRLVDHIHQHVNEQLGVEELATLAGMSISTLERRFRTHLGTSPKKFVQHAKISTACERLLNTAMTVGEVAESLGYLEHASFTRAFTSVTPLSPTAYRKYYRASGK
jgi:PAS domain S-box-containing protein